MFQLNMPESARYVLGNAHVCSGLARYATAERRGQRSKRSTSGADLEVSRIN